MKILLINHIFFLKKGGADIFKAVNRDEFGVATIKDFNAKQDHLDISDILEAYDPLSDALSDFVNIESLIIQNNQQSLKNKIYRAFSSFVTLCDTAVSIRMMLMCQMYNEAKH